MLYINAISAMNSLKIDVLPLCFLQLAIALQLIKILKWDLFMTIDWSISCAFLQAGSQSANITFDRWNKNNADINVISAIS